MNIRFMLWEEVFQQQHRCNSGASRMQFWRCGWAFGMHQEALICLWGSLTQYLRYSLFVGCRCGCNRRGSFGKDRVASNRKNRTIAATGAGAKNPRRSTRIAGNIATALEYCAPPSMAVDEKFSEGSSDSGSDYEEEESEEFSSQEVAENDEEEEEHVHDGGPNPTLQPMEGKHMQDVHQGLHIPRNSQVIE